VKQSSVERALEAMATMEKGQPYSLKPEDPKRRLADELSTICRELNIRPLLIGGLAVNHHGYMRFTSDVDLLVAREDAIPLIRHLKETPGWKRYAEGFKNTRLGVGVDICVEGERTSPDTPETFPNPSDVRSTRVRPIPIPTLPELIALKVKSGRARDDADVVELLKRHPARASSICKEAAVRLASRPAKERLDQLERRARSEAKR
jgi:hypothetical protein